MRQQRVWGLVAGVLLGGVLSLGVGLESGVAQESVLEVEGRLEETDETLGDGSFFDAYELAGDAGETFAILLESVDFDPYLLVLDEEGEEIAKNDDLAPGEGNYQAGVVLTLPETGTYRVLANSVGAGRQGAYRLQGVRGEVIPPLGESTLLQVQGTQLRLEAISLRSISQFRQAIPLDEQALAIFRSISDLSGEGAALNGLGIAYLSLGQYTRAIELFEQQLVITREIGDRSGEGNAIGNLGIAYRNLGQYTRAIELYEQQLVITREIGDRSGEGRAIGNLGIAYDNLGQYTRAIELYQQQLDIAREIGDRSGERAAINGLGSAYLSLGQYTRALSTGQKKSVGG